MENSANEENPFQDLLSAALSESGLTEDFDLNSLVDDTGGLPQPPIHAPTVSYQPVVQPVQPRHASQQNLVSSIQNIGTPIRVIRPPGTSINTAPSHSLQLGARGRGQPIVLTSTQAQQVVNNAVSLRPAVPQTVSTPTGAKAKKSIIHIVTPKNLAGVAGQGSATVKRVIQLQASNQRPSSPSTSSVQQQTGGIKVIQLGSKPAASNPHNTVTLSGGDGKTYKIVTIKSASSAVSQDESGSRVVVSSGSSTNIGNVVRTLISSQGTTPVRTVVASNSPIRLTGPEAGIATGSQVHQVRTIVCGTPVRPTSTVRTVVANPVVRTLQAPKGQVLSHTVRVLPSQAASTASTPSPVVIKTNVAGDGAENKPVTKVLKIIKPSVQSTAHDSYKVPVSVISNTHHNRIVSASSISNQPTISALSVAPVTVSSQTPVITNAVTVAKSISQSSQPATLQGSQRTIALPTPSVSPARATSPPGKLRIMTTPSVAPEDLQQQYSPPDCIVGPRTIFPCTTQQASVAPSSELSATAGAPTESQVSPAVSVPIVTTQVLPAKIDSESHLVIPSSCVQTISAAPTVSTEACPQTVCVPETEPEPPIVIEDVEVVTTDQAQVNAASQETPMEVGVAEVEAPTLSTGEVSLPKDELEPEETGLESNDADWGMFGGGGDLDLFSQALQQLSETNKIAKEFEETQKKKVLHEPKPTPATPTPSVTTQSIRSSVPQPLTPAPTPTSGSLANPTLQHVLSHVQMDDSSQSSPSFTRIVDPGRAQSPVTIIQRVSSPLMDGRPGSPQVISLPQGSTLLRTIGQSFGDTSNRQVIYTPPGTPTSIGQGLRRIISLPQVQGAGAPPSTPVGQTLRRFVPSGTRYTLPAGTPLPGGAQKVTVGSVTQLSGTPRMAMNNGVLPTVLTDKLVSQMWSNDDLKLKKIASTPTLGKYGTMVPQEMPAMRAAPSEEEMEAEDDELGHAETYADYMPPKLKIGLKHPDPVVETSSLSSVEPPGIWYKISIPEHVIDMGALSALQLETIVYASQKHETLLPSGERAGFLVGDGAGVGKGRTIAGMIYENYLQGRKRALWLSVSNDLKVDAERDLCDVGASKIEVHPLNKFKYAKISSHINGSIKKGVIFATYSSLIGESHSGGKYRTRFKQLLHWMGKDFDGIIVFDECHRAKNLCPIGSSKPTKTGMTVLELQRKLPKARIVYASATGASEPRNMAYMTRLGLWGLGTPFREFMDFIQAIEKRGVGAMELVAMDMKLRGMYIARQLSFHGVSFKIEEISIPKDFFNIYNASVKLWVEAREKFQKAADLISAEQRMRKTMWGQFWSSHQRFFKYLCISAKVPFCVKLARDAIKNGKCVVIGLQSTGEARTLEQLEDSGGELNDFVSTAKGVLQTLVEKHFPAPDRKKTMDLFGWSSSIFNSSPQDSPKSGFGSKRKKTQNGKLNKKKAKVSWSDEDSIPGSDGSEPEKPPPKLSESESSSLSLSESSDNSMDSDADDFNPFGAGSDSDDDPWLKKASKKSKEKKKKKKEKKTPKEKKKVKERENNVKKHKVKDSDSDDEFDDIDSQLDKVLMAAGLKNTEKDLSMGGLNRPVSPAKDAVEQAIDMKQELLDKIEKLGELLPPNTLDDLIDQLGGPENVAEMTGRKGRVVCTDEGYVQYESRSEHDTPLELMNLAEKQRFMDGEKFIAIISEAASSGISLQADRRVANQRRRVHITLELPWSADRAIQQFGRTHRSNQVSAPEYMFLISKLAGEKRFASTVAKRLESLGALTHGDRRATESRDLSRFNIDNKFGRAALEAVMKSVLQQEVPLVPPPENYPGNFFQDVKRGLVGVGMIAVDERTGYSVLEKEYNNISKFLNRILGMEVDVQNHLFAYFTETLAAVILQAKRNGRWDMGIQDLGQSGEDVTVTDTKVFKGNFSGSNTTVTLHTVSVERGLTWAKALDVWREYDGEHDGFYLSNQLHNGKRPPVLVIGMLGRKRERLFQVYRPNTGIQGRMEPLEDIKKKYKKVFPNDARMWWEDQYDSSATVCTHAYWRGSCRRAVSGLTCEIGLRCRLYHVLSGSVLSIWTKVESVIASSPGGLISRMQIIRLRTSDGKKIVGTLIPAQALKHLEQMLAQSAAQSPHKQVSYTPFQPKPQTVPYSSLPAYLDSPSASPHVLSTPRVLNTPPPSSSTSNQYLSMPMFL